MRAHFSAATTNHKTGRMPSTTTEKASCWEGCSLRGNGCYAETGPLNLHWSKVSDGSRAIPWSTLCDHIAKLPANQLWRHNQAGDLPGRGAWIDAELLGQLVDANAGRRRCVGAQAGRKAGFTYTHKPVLGIDAAARTNRYLIQDAILNGFMVNLSGDNPGHADWLAELGIAPVVTVLPSEYTRHHHRGKGHPTARKVVWTETLEAWRDRIAYLPTHTPAGRRIAQCPATYTDTTCLQCGACAKARDAIIGFPAHGTHRAKADAVSRVAA